MARVYLYVLGLIAHNLTNAYSTNPSSMNKFCLLNLYCKAGNWRGF